MHAILRTKYFCFQRLQYSEMAINQCQSGIDDSTDIPVELFDVDRNKLGKKGETVIIFQYNLSILNRDFKCYQIDCIDCSKDHNVEHPNKI